MVISSSPLSGSVNSLKMFAAFKMFNIGYKRDYHCIFRPSSASTTGNPKRGADKEKEGSQEYLVLLADHHLMQLPLEALNVLQTENLTSVSRDVSLQILFNKVHQQILGAYL